jgi:hypothetical protein
MAYLPPTEDVEYVDPAEDWERYARSQGLEIENAVTEQVDNLRKWLLRKSLPLALIGGVFFWGSLQIAGASHRENAKSDTLENIQIGSLLSAQNGLIISILGLGIFYYLRKTDSNE